MSIAIYVLVILIVILLAETVGLWFFQHKLTIPLARYDSAFLVYQFSIATFATTLISVPYNGLVIAHEKMGFFAIVSIIESILKLAIAFILINVSYDSLKLYAILLFSLTLLKVLAYISYCRINFSESKLNLLWDKQIFNDLLGFSGWSIFGSTVGIFRNQGVSILINMFFNPTINAAQAIALRLSTTLRTFSSNFFTAARPQIIKLYSQGDSKEFERLIISSSKYSYFLMMLLSFPLIVEIELILKYWLDIVPKYTIIFSRLAIITALIEIVNSPIITAIQATGRIKHYQVVIGTIQLLLIPFLYLAYKLGYPPQISYIIMLSLTLVNFIPRLLIYQKETKLSAINYVKKLLMNVGLVTITCLFAHYLTYSFLSTGLPRLAVNFSISLLFSPVVIFFLGLDSKEKTFLKRQVTNKINI